MKKTVSLIFITLLAVLIASPVLAQEELEDLEDIGSNNFTIECTVFENETLAFCMFSLEDLIENEEEDNGEEREELIEQIRDFVEQTLEENENENTDNQTNERPPWAD